MKYLSWFGPVQSTVAWPERLRSCVGAFIGILAVYLAGKAIGHMTGMHVWILAPLGATGFLIFVVPSSALAQPWAALGGHVVSALIGIACVRLIPVPELLLPTAVSLSILAMFLLRCLHPPAAATALFVAISGIQAFEYALFPVACGVLVLIATAVIYGKFTRQVYPHRALSRLANGEAAPSAESSSLVDVDRVLANYGGIVDVNRQDLANLVDQIETIAYKNKLKQASCESIMSPSVHCVEANFSLESAWKMLRDKHIKAMPVVDKQDRVVGIITLGDFVLHAAVDFHLSFGQRLRGVLRFSNWKKSAKKVVHSNTVGEIMSSNVRVISADSNLADLITLFELEGHHHIPVINADEKLVGIVTQSDFVKAMLKILSIQSATEV